MVDGSVPLLYRGGMPFKWKSNPDVTNVFRKWQDGDGNWWVVEFNLADLRGRIECVGVALHPVRDADDWTDDLRPLRATTMRQLPFDDVLTRARRDKTDLLRAAPAIMQAFSTHASGRRVTVGEARAAVDPNVQAVFEQLAAEDEASESRSKYSPSFLGRVASVYQAAFARGESAPSKFVERELNLTPNVARKLVHRCRGPRLRLLPPAEGTKPRGWLKGERDDEGPSR